jgi:flagellar motility protein MotE (MotC chaperone)
MSRFSILQRGALTCIVWLAVTASATAEDKPAAGVQPAAEAPPPVQAPKSAAEQYCTNIATAAADARFAWQEKRLKDLDAELKARIAELATKQAEYKDWLNKRQDFLKRAEENLVGIYSHMRPDAAAAQLSAMDDANAAAVLAKLSPRAASAILNEIDPTRAARLANTLAGGDPVPTDGKKL